jgi:hypothetical protein
MDLSALITRGFAMSDRVLRLLVVEQGACSTSGLSPDDWYPLSEPAEAARREAADAIAVCSACRVRAECLELALRNWAVGQHGVWGGTVPADRERLRAGRVAQLTRVLARNRDSDLAVGRDSDRAASLSAPGRLSAYRGSHRPTRPGAQENCIRPWRGVDATGG